MKSTLFLLLLLVYFLFLCGCSGGAAGTPGANTQRVVQVATTEVAVRNTVPVVHVFVALCDNVNQGIVPVSAALGDGDNPKTNLYWGAAFGIKTFFRKNIAWEQVAEIQNPQPAILERLVFRHRSQNIFLVADAYQGREIKRATIDFLEAAAGAPGEQLEVSQGTQPVSLHLAGSADVVAYVGHDGLMDFSLQATPKKMDARQRQAIILACASKQYFSESLRKTGALPLLWTTNLMAPEAYVLSAALDGWMKKETDEEVRSRAAKAYASYQRIGLRGASSLFATGW